uniref:RE1-silencing transcription factor n=2 Tax=Lygus hesperus TaxID=30085 RepID=A0A146KM73_LYGHE
MGAREGQRRRFEFFSYQRQDDMSIEEVAEKLELLASAGGWGKRTEAVLITKFCTMFPAHIANELAVLDGMTASFQDYVAAAIRAHDAQFLLPEDNSPNRNLRTLTELAASISSEKSGGRSLKHESYRTPRKKVKIEKVTEEGVVEEEVVNDLMERDNMSDDLDYDIIDEEPSPSGSPIHEEVITDVSKNRRSQVRMSTAGVDEVIFVVPVTNDEGEITDYVTLTNEEAKDDSLGPSGDPSKPKNTRRSRAGRPISVKRSGNYSDRPFACELCEYRATQKAALITHMRRHTGEKPYACEVCGYKTSFHASFLLHMTIHTGEKRFSCDQCDYSTSTVNNMARHRKTHSGDKPFACGFCDLRTTRKENMVKHIKKHHPDTIPAESE